MGKWLRYRIWYPLLAHFPSPLAYGLAAVFGLGELVLDRGGRQAIAKGLNWVFPQLSPIQRVLILVRYFAMRSWEVLDTFLIQANVCRAKRLVEVANLGVLSQAKAAGKGVILVMAHFGRVNLHALAMALAGERLGMLTMAIEDNPELDTIEREYLQAKATALHRYLGGYWIRVGDNLRGLYRGLAQGETIIILIDAYVPGWKKRAVTVPFLGGYLALPSGILRLARHTEARLIYASALQKGFRICGYLELLPDHPEAAFQAAIKCLERDVQSYPWLWWQWNIVPLIWQPKHSKEEA